MDVVLAQHAGFCWGVRRVVKLAERCVADAQTPVYTYGPLIHNAAVTDRLAQAGVRVIPPDADAATLARIEPGAVVIIRAHGVPPAELVRLRSAGLEIVNGTCPHVEKIQQAVARAHAAGRTVLIAGDPGHAEVVGLMAFCEPRGFVISTAAELPTLDATTPVTLVAQSTLDAATFSALSTAVAACFQDLEINDTRCDATARTQAEAYDLCRDVDMMVVIGGRHSANTNRLAQICRERGTRTLHVERAEELTPSAFSGYTRVGVTAGSSTPDWLIAEIVARLRQFPT
jgi:4-hydroxy-3-methylbut-2-enyl diphosphate reductase